MLKKNISIKTLNRSSLIIFLFFMLYIIGISSSADYGIAWDEKSEINILESNISEYIYQLCPASSQLYKEYYRNNLFNSRISVSVEKDHGMCAYYPIAYFIIHAKTPFQMFFLWHAYTFSIFFIGVVCLYIFINKLFKSRTVALITTFAYYLSPIIFAHGHFNNIDIVLLTATIVTTTFFISLVDSPKWYYILCAGLVSGIMINTRVVGAIIVLIDAVMYITICICNKQDWKKTLYVLIFGIIATITFYLSLTPAIWPNAIEYIRFVINNAKSFSRWDAYTLYKGGIYQPSTHKLPRIYLLDMILITNPLYILWGTAIGHIILLKDFIRSKYRLNQTTIVLLTMIIMWGFPLGYATIQKTTVYNGWRHFFFVLFPFIVLFSNTVNYLVNLVKEKRKAGYVGIGVIIISILYFAIGNIINHPYQYAYFNPLAGSNVDERYEIDYWDVSTNKAIQIALSDSNSDISISAYDWGSEHMLLEASETLSTSKCITVYPQEEYENADYLIVNNSYRIIFDDENYKKMREAYRLVGKITAYGHVIYEVYCKY